MNNLLLCSYQRIKIWIFLKYVKTIKKNKSITYLQIEDYLSWSDVRKYQTPGIKNSFIKGIRDGIKHGNYKQNKR